MQITVTGVQGIGQDLEKSLTRLVKQIADDVYAVAKTKTPVRSGRAKNAWTEATSKNNFRVENRVPYIDRLEAGASRQAPKGIIGPTLTTIKGKYK
jgi:hypothetical protein